LSIVSTFLYLSFIYFFCVHSKTIGGALAHPCWHQAMLNKISVFHNNRTWEIFSLPFGIFIVGCKWDFTIKVGPGGTIDRLKVRLMAKDYKQNQFFWFRLW